MVFKCPLFARRKSSALVRWVVLTGWSLLVNQQAVFSFNWANFCSQVCQQVYGRSSKGGDLVLELAILRWTLLFISCKPRLETNILHVFFTLFGYMFWLVQINHAGCWLMFTLNSKHIISCRSRTYPNLRKIYTCFFAQLWPRWALNFKMPWLWWSP